MGKPTVFVVTPLGSVSGSTQPMWDTEAGYSSYLFLDSARYGNGLDPRALNRQGVLTLRRVLTQLALDAPFSGDAYAGQTLPEIPKTLRAAAERMDTSEFLRSAFGSEVVDHYVHTARWEQFEYDRRITDWELKRGFERS